MSQVNINGKSFSGKNISIFNGRVIVDGQDQTPDDKVISISVVGDIDLLSADQCNIITVDGNVGTVKTMSGDVTVKRAVDGSVTTMSGDVTAEKIGGNVSSMSGSIKTK